MGLFNRQLPLFYLMPSFYVWKSTVAYLFGIYNCGMWAELGEERREEAQSWARFDVATATVVASTRKSLVNLHTAAHSLLV